MNNNINHNILKKFAIQSNPGFLQDLPYDAYASLQHHSSVIPVNEIQSKTAKISFTLVFAALMAISANTFFYLPFTPVPVTMQVLTVLLSAITLGSRLALLSQLQYSFAGLLGMPIFAGFKSGFTAIMGPTGGYIAGFLAAAFICGYIYENNLTERFSKYISEGTTSKSFTGRQDSKAISMFVSCIAGLAVIYLCGFIHLYGYLYMAGSSTAVFFDIFLKTIQLGVLPFVLIDFLKILIIINLYKVFK